MEIEKLEREGVAMKDLIEREMPQFRELEKEFHDRRDSFEQTKKELVGKKNELIIIIVVSHCLGYLLKNSFIH